MPSKRAKSGSTMPSVITVLKESYAFYRKHSVLNQIMLWLLALPIAAMLIGDEFIAPFTQGATLSDVIRGNARGVFVIAKFLFGIALTIVIVWGNASVLTVAKRIVKSQAGRARTSFGSVRKEAKRIIWPLIFTEVLRSALILLLTIPALIALLVTIIFFGIDGQTAGVPKLILGVLITVTLAIPAVIIGIRTAFTNIAVAADGTYYRSALKLSSSLVRGRGWRVFWYLFALQLLIEIPASILSGVIHFAFEFFPSIAFVANIATAGIWAFAMLLGLLTNTVIYAELKKTEGKVLTGSKAKKKKK